MDIHAGQIEWRAAVVRALDQSEHRVRDFFLIAGLIMAIDPAGLQTENVVTKPYVVRLVALA